MKCLAWKPLTRGSMLGFADLELGNGLILKGCTLLESNGRRWCNPPGRPTLDGERKVTIGADGRIVYASVVDFTTKAIRSKWSEAAVAAIEDDPSKAPAQGAGAMSGEDSSGGQPRESETW
jgi:hypothetical protein